MSVKKTLLSLAVAGATLAGAPAYGALVPQDGWGLNALGSANTNIGHLGLNSGLATVEQEVDPMTGTPFAGADFREFGGIFSVNITPESSPGFGDSGFPVSYAAPLDGLQIVFDGIAGTVDSFDETTGAIEYSFTAGVGNITIQGTTDGGANFTDLASLVLVNPSGGDLADFFGVGDQSQGQSTIVAQVVDFLDPTFDILIAGLGGLGFGYDDEGQLFFQFVTTNKISDPAVASGACSFDAAASCVEIGVTSDGSADLLVNRVPEPASLALLGIGLLGLGAARRRR